MFGKTWITAAMTAALALPTSVSAIADAEPSAQPRRLMCDTFYGSYWTRQDCETVGYSGLGTSWWAYQCEEDWAGWSLYVCY
ncbi:hypothetical protein GCM10010171_39700 [Actinokineospora fastidiosa]|uniref:Secreted protein n=2 Tax=Actinokineospora fastidiosa TaxID=1816 RepID=A0A918GLB5_9PSEU|nr:hypothetical protein [Actinokineospora sp. UTMC 2448]UVS77766.1 hypothetical protein Actkin_01487 [Actinokineospora sp. UTMC 2448]GGS41147.1 hypothetical protein GCM10010171_39700 [Actinokineospora fastidiosa]